MKYQLTGGCGPRREEGRRAAADFPQYSQFPEQGSA